MRSADPKDRGGPVIGRTDDGIVFGFDPGYGDELSALVVMRANADGSYEILDVRTWKAPAAT